LQNPGWHVANELSIVTQAYRLLEDSGVLEARPQSGYYVRARRWSPPPEPAMSNPAPRAVQVQVSDLVMQVIKAARNPSLVQLGATLPSAELFPLKELTRMMAAVGRRAPVQAHTYDPPPGCRALRVQVARRALEAGCLLSPDDIITTGGMCLWTELPPHINALSVYHQAMAAKISITPGQLFSAKQKFQNFIRLNCGNPWSTAIENAVRTLGDIIRSQSAKSSKLATN
jgi:DNA-binding transcriptional MocR family regulator